MDPSQTSKVNGIVRKKKEEKRNRAGPGASGATDSGSGNIDFTLRGKRGTRNKIHPKNWGYTTYLDKRCFEDLVRLRVFPDAKDISESYGVLQAALRHGIGNGTSASAKAFERLPGVVCLCIGDGATPRTAALACFLTKWAAIASIDPVLRKEWAGANPHGVSRLHGFSSKFEVFMEEERGGGGGGGGTEKTLAVSYEAAAAAETTAVAATIVEPTTATAKGGGGGGSEECFGVRGGKGEEATAGGAPEKGGEFSGCWLEKLCSLAAADHHAAHLACPPPSPSSSTAVTAIAAAAAAAAASDSAGVFSQQTSGEDVDDGDDGADTAALVEYAKTNRPEWVAWLLGDSSSGSSGGHSDGADSVAATRSTNEDKTSSDISNSNGGNIGGGSGSGGIDPPSNGRAYWIFGGGANQKRAAAATVSSGSSGGGSGSMDHPAVSQEPNDAPRGLKEKPLLDPRLYADTQALRAFRRCHKTAANAAAAAAAAAASAAASALSGAVEAGAAATHEQCGGSGGGDTGDGVGVAAHLVLLCVHAHHRFQGPFAQIPAVRAAFGSPPTTLVVLPCCHQSNPTNDIGRPPDLDFEDMAIFSEKRRVLIWKWA